MKNLSGIELIAAERQRQIAEEGYSSDHDDKHTNESLAMSAACYAAPEPILIKRETFRGMAFLDPFPWGRVVFSGRAADDPDSWHTFTTREMKSGKDRIRQLIIAGALIASEIDRINRKSALTSPTP